MPPPYYGMPPYSTMPPNNQSHMLPPPGPPPPPMVQGNRPLQHQPGHQANLSAGDFLNFFLQVIFLQC